MQQPLPIAIISGLVVRMPLVLIVMPASYAMSRVARRDADSSRASA